MLSSMLKDVELINEQLQIEAQIKINLFNDLEKKMKELHNQILSHEDSIHQITNENKSLKENNTFKNSERSQFAN